MVMLILLHVILALGSIAYSSFVFFSPTKDRFYGAYAFISGTLLSGTILVVSEHAALLPACVAGLAYLVVGMSFVVAAHRKLARVKIEK